MEIKDVFSATPKSIKQALIEPGQGLYIPAYQRPYSWGKENVARMINDIAHGLELLTKHDDAITFLGSIIFVKDEKKETVAPAVKDHLPSKVLLIIDGQQRLTTLCILLFAIYDALEKNYHSIPKEGPSAALANKMLELMNEIFQTLAMDQTFTLSNAPKEYQYYPRITKAYEDIWAREHERSRKDCGEQNYKSPIAQLLWVLIKSKTSGNLLQIDNLGLTDKTLTENMKFASKTIKKLIAENIPSDDDESDTALPQTSIIRENDILLESLNISFIKVLVGCTSAIEESSIKLIALTTFILNRVALTTIEAKNEDYAFDIFEALNTTGEPLTALETFKPWVIQKEELRNWSASSSKKDFDKIEMLLSKYDKPDAKQKETSNLLIPFSLAYAGEKLTGKIADQRKFLVKKYKQLENKNDRCAFTQQLSIVAEIYFNIWKADRDEVKFDDNMQISTEKLKIHIDFLKRSKHDISISFLACCAPHNKTSYDSTLLSKFAKNIESLVAFIIIWRITRIGTAGIDNAIRSLFKSIEGLPSLCWESKHKLSHEVLCQKLVNLLKNDRNNPITEFSDFKKKLANTPIYTVNKEVAKLALYISHNDSILRENKLVCGREGISTILTWGEWKKDYHLEHIAPKSKSDAWPQELYDDVNTVHTIGNLTLLDASCNQSLGNKSWVEKAKFYSAISKNTEQELNLLLDQMSISTPTAAILKGSGFSKFQEMFSSQATWNKTTIDQRSEDIATILWERLLNMLNISDISQY